MIHYILVHSEKPMRTFQAWKAETLWQKMSYMKDLCE